MSVLVALLLTCNQTLDGRFLLTEGELDHLLADTPQVPDEGRNRPSLSIHSR